MKGFKSNLGNLIYLHKPSVRKFMLVKFLNLSKKFQIEKNGNLGNLRLDSETFC